MYRISVPWLFDVVASIDSLNGLKAGVLNVDNWILLYSAKSKLAEIFEGSIYRDYLMVSRQSAEELFGLLNDCSGDSYDENRLLEEAQIWQIRFKRDSFRTILIAEMAALPSFLVARKEGYDTNYLITEGAKLFPSALKDKVPEALRDAQEAGKALAFEVPTASGFHTFRIVESVLRRYWDEVAKPNVRPSLQSLGGFVNALEKGSFGDIKVIESLKQMTKLHRNPLVHPEVLLSIEEAVEILGIARSVIGMMLRVLPDVPATTGASDTTIT